MVASGRRRIAIHCLASGFDMRHKSRVVAETLRESGLAAVPLPVPATASAKELAMFLRDNRGAFDAVFCRNDLVAAGVLTAILALGLRVPEDVLVIGCDGQIPLPGIWTAFADHRAMAKMAIGHLQRQIDGDCSKRSVRLQLELRTP